MVPRGKRRAANACVVLVWCWEGGAEHGAGFLGLTLELRPGAAQCVSNAVGSGPSFLPARLCTGGGINAGERCSLLLFQEKLGPCICCTRKLCVFPPPIRPCTVPGYPKVVLGTPTQGPGSPKGRSWEPQGGPGHPKVRSWVPQGKVLGTPGSPWTLTKFPASTLQEAKHSAQPSTRADFLFFSF